MVQGKSKILYNCGIVMLVLSLSLTGCGFLTPVKKPEVGPAGKPVESLPNPPVNERFWSAPATLYDLEAMAGVIFEGINKERWPQAESGLMNLQATWQQTKPLIGEKKGVKEADETLGKLSSAIADKRITDSYENLIKFMSSIGDIGKSYKLSPIANIIAVDNGVRNVNFYVEDKNWSKAASKVKELEDIWGRAKTGLESIGILGEITRTSSLVKQLKDAVNAENKGAVEEYTAEINDSLGSIREFYRGR